MLSSKLEFLGVFAFMLCISLGKLFSNSTPISLTILYMGSTQLLHLSRYNQYWAKWCTPYITLHLGGSQKQKCSACLPLKQKIYFFQQPLNNISFFFDHRISNWREMVIKNRLKLLFVVSCLKDRASHKFEDDALVWPLNTKWEQ